MNALTRVCSAISRTLEVQGKPLKILHIFDHSLPMMSGYTIRSLSLLQEQRRRGWQTAHLTTPKHTLPGPSPERVNDLLFHRSARLSATAEKVPYFREVTFIRNLAREISRVARIEAPHILHAHSPALNGIAALWAGRRLNLPVAYEIRAFWEDAAVDHGTATEGGLRYRLTRAMETYVLQHCNAAATICEGLRRDIAARGIPEDKVTVIPNGVRIEDFPFSSAPNADLKVSLGLEGQIVFGFLGSFYAYEGLDLLLDSLPAVLRQHSKTIVLLAGGGPAENTLREKANRLGLSDRVRFLGRIPHDKIQEYYSVIDILVYPRHRLRLTEAVTPLKPLEAMAQGRIVLASDVGGHRELIAHGVNGRLFSAGDKTALAEAMLGLIADQGIWPSIRQTARAFIERERSWEQTTKEYSTLYERALRSHHNMPEHAKEFPVTRRRAKT